MPIDFRNTNTVWASVLVETLVRLGLKTAIICPGSRSAPLAIAFSQHPEVNALSILDERSAAFFALGHGRQTHQPVALICTSGTAGANFYPAMIEASESRVPLLALTADRPPELRHCHAGQAIDQIRLFGQYPNWQIELACPDAAVPQLAYLRQTLKFCWEKALWPVPGPVHINCPFRDPLIPRVDGSIQTLQPDWDEAKFFEAIQPLAIAQSTLNHHQIPIETWKNCDRGLIIAGPAQPKNPSDYCGAIALLSKCLGWPVLAEGLSPLRNYASINPNLIASYAIALKNPKVAQDLAPNQVIRVGELPISKELRQWLGNLNVPQWIIDCCDHNLDAVHSHSTHLRLDIETLVNQLQSREEGGDRSSDYLNQWIGLESQVQGKIQTTMESTPEHWESKVAWTLAQTLPRETPLFISNSMPVRDVEWFWPKGDSHIHPCFNRGANGIDGIISSAMGMAYQQQPSVLLTGDLAFLHDTNGLLPNPRWQGHLTIVVINNDGGGIFEMLPIAQYDPPFEEYFATPQRVNIAQLCKAYGLEHEVIHSWEGLINQLNPLPNEGIRVLEVKCDRRYDSEKRKKAFSDWPKERIL